MRQKAQDTPTEPATETQAAEKVEMPTETEAVTEVVTEAAKKHSRQKQSRQKRSRKNRLPNSRTRSRTIQVKIIPLTGM